MNFSGKLGLALNVAVAQDILFLRRRQAFAFNAVHLCSD
jgi:hypothetical protein